MSEQPTTERSRRAETVAAERRRRKNVDEAVDPLLERFGVSADILDLKQYVYRSAEDRGMRLHNLTKRDDWDFVVMKAGAVEVTDRTDATGVLRHQSGTVDGKPVYSYLLRKLKRYADVDRAERANRILSDQKVRLTEVPTDSPDLQNAYVPKT